METLIWAYYVGLSVFALNGLIFMALFRKLNKFNRRAKTIEGLLQELKLRRRNKR